MRNTRRQLVLSFSEADGLDVSALGGKAAGLIAMRREGFPVPPGFLITTGACRANWNGGSFPTRLNGQLQRAVRQLERETGKRFGGRRDPLLLSVRSGAPVSMPGMMDTILNLGITPASLPALQRLYGAEMVATLQTRFNEALAALTTIDTPEDAWEQLELAIEVIWSSWNSERAVAYRRAHGISDQLGTAVICQQMVFGLGPDSGTGVIFSRNVTNGDDALFGEYLSNAQGEELVSGKRNPRNLEELAYYHPSVHSELVTAVQKLDRLYDDAVEVEFTFERGKLHFLQVRNAKRSIQAKARFAVRSVWAGKATKDSIVAKFTRGDVDALRRPKFEEKVILGAVDSGRYFTSGIAASPGAAIGKAAFSSERAVAMAELGAKVVLIRPDTNPNDLPGMLKAVAVVTDAGGSTCHAALVARSLGIPAVVGVDELVFEERRVYSPKAEIREGDIVSVDGSGGLVVVGRVPFTTASHDKEVTLLLKWFTLFRPELMQTTIKVDFSAIDRMASANRILCDFYLAEAMAAAAVDSELAFETQQLFDQVTTEAATVLLTYLLVAVCGEVQYVGDNTDPASTALRELFGNSRSFRELSQLTHFQRLQKCSRERHLEFFRLAEEAFTAQGSGPMWWGGRNWAAIAAAARKLLDGTLNATVFVDHVFDLRHNGGRLFNKHDMTSSLTNEDALQQQLEVKKRSKSCVELRWGLAQKAPAKTRAFSEPVDTLWRKGKKLGLWARAREKVA